MLRAANSVTGTVAEQNAVVDKLIDDADLLLVELEKRRAAIHTLFQNTSALSQQVTGLVRDNRAEKGAGTVSTCTPISSGNVCAVTS